MAALILIQVEPIAEPMAALILIQVEPMVEPMGELILIQVEPMGELILIQVEPMGEPMGELILIQVEPMGELILIPIAQNLRIPPQIPPTAYRIPAVQTPVTPSLSTSHKTVGVNVPFHPRQKLSFMDLKTDPRWKSSCLAPRKMMSFSGTIAMKGY
jgi:hypothetical protein